MGKSEEICRGMLKKKRTRLNAWADRYFILKQDSLESYNNRSNDIVNKK